MIDKEMYKEAVSVYLDALKYNPVSFEINYNLGIVYTMLNDFQSAKICYEKAAQINSLLYNAKYSLAEIALIYKELEEAKQRLLEAIEDDELSADGYYELAKIHLIQGDKDTAIKYVNTAIDIDSAKIVDKVKKDAIFIPIMARISIPFNFKNQMEMEDEEGDKKKHKLSKKEIKAKEHLEKMSEITRNLSYNDINLLKNNSNAGGKKKEETKKEIEDWQKEIQD